MNKMGIENKILKFAKNVLKGGKAIQLKITPAASFQT